MRKRLPFLIKDGRHDKNYRSILDYLNEYFGIHRGKSNIRACQDTAQTSLACGSLWHKILFNKIEWDSKKEFNLKNSRWLPKRKGKTILSVQVCINNYPVSKSVALRINRNGLSVVYVRQGTPANGGLHTIDASGECYFDSGDIFEIEIRVWDGASTFDTYPGSSLTFLEIRSFDEGI